MPKSNIKIVPAIGEYDLRKTAEENSNPKYGFGTGLRS